MAFAQTRPNIVYILADDMGIDSVSVHNPKMGPLKTLNIDRIAAAGMNFTADFARFNQLEQQGVDLRANFKGRKGQLHEGGHRVPFMVRWPGVVEPGSVCHDLTCLNDFLATLAEMLDTTLPADAGEDSISILPLLTGELERLPDRPPVIHHDYGGNFAIRDGKWKFVGHELYDLETDAKETRDLADQHPEVVERLASALRSIRETGRTRVPADPTPLP